MNHKAHGFPLTTTTTAAAMAPALACPVPSFLPFLWNKVGTYRQTLRAFSSEATSPSGLLGIRTYAAPYMSTSWDQGRSITASLLPQCSGEKALSFFLTFIPHSFKASPSTSTICSIPKGAELLTLVHSPVGLWPLPNGQDSQVMLWGQGDCAFCGCT